MFAGFLLVHAVRGTFVVLIVGSCWQRWSSSSLLASSLAILRLTMASPVRTDRLRALSARVGYAYRTSQLSGSDVTRFLSPLIDIMHDLRDELAHVRRCWPVTSAPTGVKMQMDLLHALAQRPTSQVSDSSCDSSMPIVIKLHDHLSDLEPIAGLSSSRSDCLRVPSSPIESCKRRLSIIAEPKSTFGQGAVVHRVDASNSSPSSPSSCVHRMSLCTCCSWCGSWNPLLSSTSSSSVGVSCPWCAIWSPQHEQLVESVNIVDNKVVEVPQVLPRNLGAAPLPDVVSHGDDVVVAPQHEQPVESVIMAVDKVVEVPQVVPSDRGVAPMLDVLSQREDVVVLRENVAGVESDIQVLLGLDVSHCRMRRYSFNLSDGFVMDYWRKVLPPCAQVERMLGYLSDSD